MSNKKKILIVLFVALLIYFFRYEIYYTYLSIVRYRSKSKENEEYLKELHPVLRYKISKVIKEAEDKGCVVKINSGHRDEAKQLYLYQTGQTPVKRSKHNYRAAIDMNICGLLKAGSISSWKYWGELGESLGLLWGGRFNNIHDPVHFELSMTIDELVNSNKLIFGKYVKTWK